MRDRSGLRSGEGRETKTQHDLKSKETNNNTYFLLHIFFSVCLSPKT
jgi:hypothetical protein